MTTQQPCHHDPKYTPDRGVWCRRCGVQFTQGVKNMTEHLRMLTLEGDVNRLRRDLDRLTSVVEKLTEAFAALLVKLKQREEYEQEQREREG